MKYKNGWKKRRGFREREKRQEKKYGLGHWGLISPWNVGQRWVEDEIFVAIFFRKLVQKGGAGGGKKRRCRGKKGEEMTLSKAIFLGQKKFRELTYWKGLARVEKFQCSKIWAWNFPEISKEISEISLELSFAWIGPENFWKFPRKFRGEISTGNFLATLGRAWQILTCLVNFFKWHNCL